MAKAVFCIVRDQIQAAKIVSELRVQPAQIVDVGQPHRRFSVNLLIERPQKLRWFSGERDVLEKVCAILAACGIRV